MTMEFAITIFVLAELLGLGPVLQHLGALLWRLVFK